MKQELGTAESGVAPFVSLFWASLMIGRWTSAAGAFNISNKLKSLLGFVLPFVAFGIFLFVNWIAGNEMQQFYPYIGLVILLIIADKKSHVIKKYFKDNTIKKDLNQTNSIVK